MYNELVEKLVLKKLMEQGFDDIHKLVHDPKVNFSQFQPINVIDLDEISNFIILSLDARLNKEFKDFVYVAIEQETNELLEIIALSNAPKIYHNDEAQRQIQTFFPNLKPQIKPEYFWRLCFELRSRLSIVRCFFINDREMFLLPNGNITEHLTKL
jgi:hypothetical protein